MIEPMSSVTVLAPRSLGEMLIPALQHFGKLQLVLQQRRQDGQGTASQLLLLREQLVAIMEKLGVKDLTVSKNEVDALEERMVYPLERLIPEIDGSLRKFRDDLDRLSAQEAELRRKNDELQFLLDRVGAPLLPEIPGNHHGLWWLRRQDFPGVMRQIQEAQGSAQGEIKGQLHPFSKDDMALAEVSLPQLCAPLARRILEDSGATQWRPPQGCRDDDYPSAVLSMRESLESNSRRLQELDQALEQARKRWGPKQRAFFHLIERKLEQLQVLEQCQTIGEALVIQGWLPQVSAPELREFLAQRFGSSVVLLEQDPEPDQYAAVPILLRHNDFFRPFELFLKLVRPPAYGTTDPTVMIGLFFPLFSGCIVGDGGYGLVMLLLTWWMRRRCASAVLRDGAFILMTVAVWSVLWGCAFGEFFGDLGHRVFHLAPLWVERSHVVLPVLFFSISLGLGHVLIGLAMGVIQGFRGRHRRHALEKLGNILVVLAMVGALMGARQYLPAGALPASLAAGILGVVLLMVGGGIGGLVESMSTFGNILSYVRIGAIGLSSAILAVAASKFIDVLGLSFLGLFMALAIHLLNFVLAFGESGLHSARLHYVEFMGKFYDGRGLSYKPFAYRRDL